MDTSRHVSKQRQPSDDPSSAPESGTVREDLPCNVAETRPSQSSGDTSENASPLKKGSRSSQKPAHSNRLRNVKQVPVRRRLENSSQEASGLNRGLGLFSLGLGIAEILAPVPLARAIGLPQKSARVLAIYGLREIAAGLGLLIARRKAGWLWFRVAGDALDLATLGGAAADPQACPKRLAAAAANVGAVTAVDVIAAVRQTKFESQAGNGQFPPVNGGIKFQHRLVINSGAEELYRRWRDFESFPSFMSHVESVTVDGGRSHWVSAGPLGTRLEWDAEIVADRPNEVISWRSVAGSVVDNTGSVRFERATGGRGTIVHVEMQFRPPLGKAGATVAKIFGTDPEQQVKEDLRRFKQLVETGEVPTTQGQPAARSFSSLNGNGS